MKEGLLCGVALGMVAGIMLYKYNDKAKEIVNKGEKAIKNELKKVAK